MDVKLQFILADNGIDDCGFWLMVFGSRKVSEQQSS
jgi:hypothetical protein